MQVLRLVVVILLATSLEAGPEATHTGTFSSPHFEVRYRLGSRAGAVVESTASQAERALTHICESLGVENDGKYALYLYDHAAELAAITGNAVGGFANGVQVHVPIDNLQTLAHEITHVVTHRIPKSGEEARNMFFVEGIANALLEYVHGVPVHAVAKYYRARKRLPRLKEMLGAKDFYAWLRARPGFNGYDVGASFMRFVIDSYGMPNTIRFYTGTTAADALGVKSAALEAGWHKTLDAFVMRPEVEILLKRRHAEPAEFDDYGLVPFDRLPPDIRGKDDDWKELIGKKPVPEAKADWKRTGKALSGTTTSTDWSWCALGKKAVGDAVVTAILKPAPNCLGVAVRLGDDTRALLVQAGTFLFTTDNQFVSSKTEERLGSRAAVELTLVRIGNRVRIFVDGNSVLDGVLSGKKGVPAVGVAQGSVEVASVRVRIL